MSFDLLKGDTESCVKGQYEWSAAIHSGGVEITRVKSGDNKTQLVEKFT